MGDAAIFFDRKICNVLAVFPDHAAGAGWPAVAQTTLQGGYVLSS
jgi:hypothetical protein